MHSPILAGEQHRPESLVSSRVGTARLGIGLLQGLVLYLLYSAGRDQRWPANEALLFAPLLLVALLTPVILGASLGHMNRRQVWTWVCGAAAIVAALGVYDIWRVAGARWPGAALPATKSLVAMPSPLLGLFLVVGLFIAQSLVMAAASERRRIASYPAYFETAWKLGVQLAFSALFVGAVWLVLFLGAQLFLLVKLNFLDELLKKSWFAIPVSAFGFSCAMHLTDVRPAIVRGIRGLLLMLLSWVLPVMTVIVGGFILSLPFTGLAPLWATRHAGSVLLSAAAAFVVLINTAYQDGEMDVARAIGYSARAACVLLLPITAIAVYALALRVGDYGWSADRVAAAACLVVASCYALGYAGAVFGAGRMAAISRVNVATAFVVLATLLLLFSPVADPARLSVNSQLARLSSGKVSVAKFDFAYLRFEGGRYGRDALARLAATATGPEAALLRSRIAAVGKLSGPWQSRNAALPPPDIAVNLHVWPSGTRLPDSFLHTDWLTVGRDPLYPECLRQAGKRCDAFLLDLNGDGKPEVILVGTETTTAAAVLGQDKQGQWRALGRLPFYFAGCEAIRKSLIAGNFRSVQPALGDLEVAGKRFHIEAPFPVEPECLRK